MTLLKKTPLKATMNKFIKNPIPEEQALVEAYRCKALFRGFSRSSEGCDS